MIVKKKIANRFRGEEGAIPILAPEQHDRGCFKPSGLDTALSSRAIVLVQTQVQQP